MALVAFPKLRGQ